MMAMIGYQPYTQFAIFSTFQYDVHVMKFVEKRWWTKEILTSGIQVMMGKQNTDFWNTSDDGKGNSDI